VSIHVPFWIAVVAIAGAVVLLVASGHRISDAVAVAEAADEQVLPTAAGDAPAEPVVLVDDALDEDASAIRAAERRQDQQPAHR